MREMNSQWQPPVATNLFTHALSPPWPHLTNVRAFVTHLNPIFRALYDVAWVSMV